MASSTVWTDVSLLLKEAVAFHTNTHEDGPHGPYVVVAIDPYNTGHYAIHFPNVAVIDRLIDALTEGRAWLADQPPTRAADDREERAA